MRKALLAALCLAPLVIPSAARADVLVSRHDIAVGAMQPNTTLNFDVKVVNTDRGSSYQLTPPVTAGSGVAATLGSTSVGNNPVILKVTLSAGSSPGPLAGSVSFSYRRVEGNGEPQFGSFQIPVTAEVLCAIGSANCNPSIPVCNVDETKPLQYLKVLDSAIVNMSAAQSAHRRLHNAGDDTYKMDYDFLFNVAGLSQFFTVPPACPTGPSQCVQACDCNRPFEFAHIPGAPRVASFRWSGTARNFSTPVQLPDWKVEFSVPANVDGYTVVTGGYNEYIFEVASRPTLRVYYQGTAIYDGPVACLSARTTKAQLKHPGATGKRPDVDLVTER